jgi:hypothetical protein
MGGKKALLVIAATASLAFVPAADAFGSVGARVLVYKITRASGYIRADFRGNENAGCKDRGVCGYDGAVQYLFGGRPRSAEAFLLLDKRSGFVGGGNYRTTAATLAKVAIPGSDDCTDTVAHSADNFQLLRRGTKITVTFHSAQADTGLTLAQALPTGTFPVKSFKALKVDIVLAGQKSFTGGGFGGTASWNVHFTLQESRSSRGVSTAF